MTVIVELEPPTDCDAKTYGRLIAAWAKRTVNPAGDKPQTPDSVLGQIKRYQTTAVWLTKQEVARLRQEGHTDDQIATAAIRWRAVSEGITLALRTLARSKNQQLAHGSTALLL